MSCASAVLPRKNQAVEWIELAAGNTPWLGLVWLGFVWEHMGVLLLCAAWERMAGTECPPYDLRTAGIITRYGGYRYPWMSDMITPRMPGIYARHAIPAAQTPPIRRTLLAPYAGHYYPYAGHYCPPTNTNNPTPCTLCVRRYFSIAKKKDAD